MKDKPFNCFICPKCGKGHATTSDCVPETTEERLFKLEKKLRKLESLNNIGEK